MDERMRDVEARVPPPMPFDRAVHCCRVLYSTAKTRRADKGAIAAGKAALCHVVPARVLQVACEEVPYALGVESAAHLTGRLFDHGCARGEIGVPCRRAADLIGNLRSPRGADSDEVSRAAGRGQLAEGKVEALVDSWSGTHRRAETSGSR